MSATFLEAREADLPAVVRLLADDPLGAGREAAPDDPAYARAFAAMQAQTGNRLYVAEEDGEIMGCLQLVLIPGLSHAGTLRAEIEAVRVAPGRRGAGLGAALAAFAVEEARRAGPGRGWCSSPPASRAPTPTASGRRRASCAPMPASRRRCKARRPSPGLRS